jgi:hypothetical protein
MHLETKVILEDGTVADSYFGSQTAIRLERETPDICRLL